jgi:hypothetical protein
MFDGCLLVFIRLLINRFRTRHDYVVTSQIHTVTMFTNADLKAYFVHNTQYVCDTSKYRIYHSQSQGLITYCHKNEKQKRNFTRQTCYCTAYKRTLR